MPVNEDDLRELRIDRSGEEGGRPKAPLVVGGALLLVILIAALLFWVKRPSEAVVTTAIATAVSSDSDGMTLLNANGYVTARRQATVSSEVTGRVTEVLVEEGMIVQQGDVLARIDPSTPDAALQLALAQAKAAESSLRETEVRVEEARLELQRARSLTEQKVASQRDLDRAEAALQALEARLVAERDQLAVARRQVRLRQQGVSDTVIRAPFSGVIVSKNAQPGEMISPMSAGGSFTRTGICTIVDMDSLEIEVDVNEAYINRVTAGQPVVATLDAYPDWEIPAHVIAVIPTADRQKATVRVRIGIDTSDRRILPDMGVKVRFLSRGGGNENDSRPGVSIPVEALRRAGESDIVFVVRDGKLERRAVAVGSRNDQTVVVQSGLSAGEQVVTGSEAELADGLAVRTEER